MDSETFIQNIIDKTDRITYQSKSDLMCAPGLKYEAGSCARIHVLKELAKAYNKSNQHNPIRLSDKYEILHPLKYKEYIVSQIKDRIGNECTNQKCWAHQEFINNMEKDALIEFKKYTYRTKSPQGKWEWLNTVQIYNAMNQYEKKYTNFKFLGAIPMDFASLNLDINDIDYGSEVKNGKTRFGVIFNLDNHDQEGSHWVAMITDFEKKEIFYFDSVGIKPEQRVAELMNQQVNQMIDNGVDFDSIRVDYNKKRHQYGNSECGVYSMNFLIRMARGIDFDELCNNPIPDKIMNKCRKVYFDKYD